MHISQIDNYLDKLREGNDNLIKMREDSDNIYEYAYIIEDLIKQMNNIKENNGKSSKIFSPR